MAAMEVDAPDDGSSDQELWDLVYQYKALKDHKRQLLADGGQDDDSSESSESQLSLITDQLEALAHLGSMGEKAVNVCYIPGVSSAEASAESDGSLPFHLDDVKVPKIKENCSIKTLISDVEEFTKSLELSMHPKETLKDVGWKRKEQSSPGHYLKKSKLSATVDMEYSKPGTSYSKQFPSKRSIFVKSTFIKSIPLTEPVYDLAWTTDQEVLVVVGGKLERYDMKGCKKVFPYSVGDRFVISVAAHHKIPVVAWISKYPVTLLYILRGGETKTVGILPDSFWVRFGVGAGNVIVGGFHSQLMNYDVSGKLIWRMNLSMIPWYMAVGSANEIVINGSDVISAFYDESKGSSLPKQRSLIDKPTESDFRGICVDIAGNLYVADRFNQKVQLFSSEGHCIGGIDVKKSPVNLALFQDKYLCVGHNSYPGGSSIEVFSIN